MNVINTATDYSTSGVAFNAVLDVTFSAEGNTEPCTLLEAKNWLKIDSGETTDDTDITELITVARIMCEQYANISFINRTVTATLNNSCGNGFLPYGPVKETSSFTDIDGNDITGVTLRGSSFKFLSECYGHIIIVYTAGYTTLPPNLKRAVLNQVAYLYDNRGDNEQQGKLSVQAKTILNQVRR